MRKRSSGSRLFPVALYAGLPSASQLQALEPAPRGYRKVGFYAETVFLTGIRLLSLNLTARAGRAFLTSCFTMYA